MQEVFSKAVRANDAEGVRAALADPHVDPAADNNFSIRLASAYGHAEVVRALLADARVDPAANNNHAIREASAFGHAEVVRALLADPRVDPASNDNAPIQRAYKWGRAEIVRALLADSRVDPAANNNYAIQWASAFGHTEVVRALLADPRVDPRVAIQESTPECARIIATDDARGGIERHYELFEEYHPTIVGEYQARLRQCYALAWVATQEWSWTDLVEPVSKRLKVLL